MISHVFDLTKVMPDDVRTFCTGLSMEVSVRDHFGLFDEYVNWLKQGKKSTTIRFRQGKIDLPNNSLLPVCSTDLRTRVEGSQVGWAQINQLIVKPFGELNDEDARNDGFRSLSDLKQALQAIYGNIHEDETVSVYCFDFVELQNFQNGG
jgi:hypothetical protein